MSNHYARQFALLALTAGAGCHPRPLVPLSGPTPGNGGWFSGTAVVTNRNNNGRTGATLGERALTVASVTSGEFRKIGAFPVQGQVYAQPLYVPHVPQPDGTVRNLLVVATMHDMLYVFDADAPLKSPGTTPSPLMAYSLGTPLRFNYMSMALANFMLGEGVLTIPNLAPNDKAFYNIYPEIGITSTPVVDTMTMRVYAVAKVRTAAGVVALQLWAFDLATHSVVAPSPVTLAATVPGTGAGSIGGILTFDPKFQHQRASLLLSRGSVYIGFGSHQDTPPFHGWLLRHDAASLQQTGVWCATPDGAGGSIWHAGSGLAADDSGRVYAITSNGLLPADMTGPRNLAQRFVQFSPSLGLLAAFMPPDAVKKSEQDVDLGSSGPVLLPGTRMVIGAGKDGVLFLLDGDAGLASRQSFQASKKMDVPSLFGFGFHHLHGSPVVWRTGSGRMLVYLWPERDNLRVFQYDSGVGRFAPDVPVQMSAVEAPLGFPIGISMPGGILSLSAYGSEPGSGLIWASIPTRDDAMHAVVKGTLRVFNAADVTQELWNSEQRGRDRVGRFAKFTPPTIANGRVYLATFSNAVLLYGLRQWATFVSQSPVPATLKPGDRFTGRVTMANTGSKTWAASGRYALGLASAGDSTTWGTNRVPLPRDVSPGDTVSFDVTFVAPATPGSASLVWRMVQGRSGWFGEMTPKQTVQSR
jgi:hypothetical protein